MHTCSELCDLITGATEGIVSRFVFALRGSVPLHPLAPLQMTPLWVLCRFWLQTPGSTVLRGDLVRETFSFFTLFPALLGAKAPSHHPALGGADGFFLFTHWECPFSGGSRLFWVSDLTFLLTQAPSFALFSNMPPHQGNPPLRFLGSKRAPHPAARPAAALSDFFFNGEFKIYINM